MTIQLNANIIVTSYTYTTIFYITDVGDLQVCKGTQALLCRF